ncbi:MAG: hypothetical protein EPO55_00675 [Reyranella sp.]|uniref:hypothetical protein n=1 Tax=Reyranella sp. TaxID=1929291 RepID=UPI0012074CD1|nr:hypothetical protein [Reyranella sp.]TAJ42775.1 MAG: hypothetical protein EPO55_00675 [Reyranella sp.]
MFKFRSGASVPSTRKTDMCEVRGWDRSADARTVEVQAELLPPEDGRNTRQRAVVERDEIPVVTFRVDR